MPEASPAGAEAPAPRASPVSPPAPLPSPSPPAADRRKLRTTRHSESARESAKKSHKKTSSNSRPLLSKMVIARHESNSLGRRAFASCVRTRITCCPSLSKRSARFRCGAEQTQRPGEHQRGRALALHCPFQPPHKPHRPRLSRAAAVDSGPRKTLAPWAGNPGRRERALRSSRLLLQPPSRHLHTHTPHSVRMSRGRMPHTLRSSNALCVPLCVR